jgi:hypothetical protein
MDRSTGGGAQDRRGTVEGKWQLANISRERERGLSVWITTRRRR